MASVYKICVALITAEKKKSNPDFENIIGKMDIYFAANRLTKREYSDLIAMIDRW